VVKDPERILSSTHLPRDISTPRADGPLLFFPILVALSVAALCGGLKLPAGEADTVPDHPHIPLDENVEGCAVCSSQSRISTYAVHREVPSRLYKLTY
jgi:hypothetical protein